MSETIKETYKNIETIILNSVNNLLFNKVDLNLIKYTEYNIFKHIHYIYPNYDFTFTLNYDEFRNCLNPNFSLSAKYFKSMITENFITHNFIDSGELFYRESTLKCQNCNILITDSGKPIDGDYSCEEWIIKNIIE